MAVQIAGILPDSPAARTRMEPGDFLHRINGHEIVDILDYQFYVSDRRLTLALSGKQGWRMLRIEKNEYEDLGLTFDTYLMDKQRHCANKCIFCFIDQLPKGLRDSLYFKDDDARLSFLFGNYITLTNLKEHDIARIIGMHISPVNISVHTMDPALRVKMMGNPNAGKSLAVIDRFAQAGIRMNTQLVLCPGINDGPALQQSLAVLGRLYPQVQSIAAVPVGLTRYRDGLSPLEPYDAQTAGAVLDCIESFGNAFAQKHGTRLAFPADEFYLKAGRPIPGPDFYEEFAQLENGVGLWASLRSEFFQTLDRMNRTPGDRRITMATSTSAAPLICELADAACRKWASLQIRVLPIVNHFFGERINVAGLLTGTDYQEQLASCDLGDELLIPAVSLRREGDLFLDGCSLTELSASLQTPIRPVENEGDLLLQAMLGV